MDRVFPRGVTHTPEHVVACGIAEACYLRLSAPKETVLLCKPGEAPIGQP